MLYYNQYGKKDAPLIVFLHGGGVTSWMWDKQIQYFKSYHCVTIDLPEQGLNKYKGNFSIEYSAQKVIELIELVAGGRTVTVVGFSLGSQVLIQMLSMRHDLIDCAMINSALVRPSKIFEKIVNSLIHLTYPLIKNKTYAKLQARTLLIGNDYFDTYYEESSNMERNTLIRIMKENMSFSIPQQFKNAKAKILVTVGEKEKSMMKKSALDIVNSNSNCTGIIISDVGHGVPLANPNLFNTLLETWLEENLK